VRMNFGSVARIAGSADEFVKLCSREVDKPTRSRIKRGLELAAENTWEAIIARMEGHIADVFAAINGQASAADASLTPNALGDLAYV
jgi:hypothetical protein